MLICALGSSSCAQDGGRREAPPPRIITETSSRPLELAPADQQVDGFSYRAEIRDGMRHISASGIANHKVGAFPSPGNPHAIQVQNYTFQVPVKPAGAAAPIFYGLSWNFGITRSATIMDPQAAEFWNGDRNSGWQYEALGGAVSLGLDENHAHVQPNGAYHYHGWPFGVLEAAGWSPDAPSPLIGWAADGYPIYAANLMVNEELVSLKSSYRLQSGERPVGAGGPTGNYDGAFVQDYEFIPGFGDLDICNGTVVYTDEFPDGTYAYIITSGFPVIPRCFRSEPDISFLKSPGRR